MNDAPGTLYIVSTPIGNLGDLSTRAIETLRNVAVVLAEDTRHSRPLLAAIRDRYAAALVSRAQRGEATAERWSRGLIAGESFALISDAGTPLLSDPGARLVRAAIDAGISAYRPIPGALALLSALVASGISASRFTFFGFLERKGEERTSAHRGDCGADTYGGAVRGGAAGGGNAARSLGARLRRAPGRGGAGADEAVRGVAAGNARRARGCTTRNRRRGARWCW